ncbi:hypothetical protein CH252_08405 [Rhodococcus sp. 06-1477-1B]|nr:hypothetical protein CH266_18120 [Rhodococcus sp. 06-1474-1B]OZD55155.1 hypothetical protein CH252_08405 [Rhodococcus sp. 06-1477-1B]
MQQMLLRGADYLSSYVSNYRTYFRMGTAAELYAFLTTSKLLKRQRMPVTDWMPYVIEFSIFLKFDGFSAVREGCFRRRGLHV